MLHVVLLLTMESVLLVKTALCGYHIYRAVWELRIGDLGHCVLSASSSLRMLFCKLNDSG